MTSITIQSRRDHQYLCAPGKWQARPEEALRFEHSVDAVRYCVREHLTDVAIVFAFENPKFNFAVRVASDHNPS